MRLLTVFCLFMLLTIALPSASEDIAANWQLNGSAKFIGSTLRLTNDAWQAGSAFWKDKVDISQFDTTFKFHLNTASTKGMADGFTFCVQNDPRGAKALGGVGGPLGYGTEKATGIKKSIAVEFDNYCNTDDGFPDTHHDHIGLNINANMVSTKTARLPMSFTYSELMARIKYDGGTLQVFVWRPGQEQGEPLLSERIDIPSTVGSREALIGFTAGTGKWHQNHDISEWKI